MELLVILEKKNPGRFIQRTPEEILKGITIILNKEILEEALWTAKKLLQQFQKELQKKSQEELLK